MRSWTLNIPLDPASGQPLFLQMALAIADKVHRGHLKAGDPLPGSRELSAHLGVNRSTVVAAYRELESEGLLSTRVGCGTFVTATLHGLPESKATHVAPLTPTYEIERNSASPAQEKFAKPHTLILSSMGPDPRLFPARQLARAFRRAVENGRRLQSTGACGLPRLREQLASMLVRMRGLDVTPGNLMITRSIEQGIDLVARTLISPGDAVVVESFGYPPAWQVLKLAGARLIPLPLDDDGLDINALEVLLDQQRIRAVFVTPHHQFPTTAIMSNRRRERLATLSVQHRFAIIEDDYDHEFHYGGAPVPPIAAGPNRQNVIYVGSLANILAPAISTGFVVAPPAVFDQFVRMRAYSDPRADSAMECAVAELFEDGELLRHVLRIRHAYSSRRDAFAASLTRYLGDAISFKLPEGGMAIWARVNEGIDLASWCRIGEAEGVVFSGAQPYDFFNRHQPFMRLGFCYHTESELTAAARLMGRALAQELGATSRQNPISRRVRDGIPVLDSKPSSSEQIRKPN